jgi:hypothetical protein
MVFARSPAALWLGCGALALLAALTIVVEARQPEPLLPSEKMEENGGLS